MFYSTQILARKGPLGIIWIAAHMDKNLKRSQVAGAHIPGTVDALLDPEAPLALRLSGQLLLGVVRVYSRQLSFLQQDCQDALIRIRLTINADRQGGATATLLLPGGSSQDPEEVIPYDLEDVEVERLRDAPAPQPAAAADVLQGLGMGDVEQELKAPDWERAQGLGVQGREQRSSEGSGGIEGEGTPTAVAVRNAAAAAAAGGRGMLLPPGASGGREGEEQGGPEGGMGSSRQGSRLLGAPDSHVSVRARARPCPDQGCVSQTRVKVGQHTKAQGFVQARLDWNTGQDRSKDNGTGGSEKVKIRAALMADNFRCDD
ncbi:Rec8 like protein-domain-containing protein [Dunaliella salina]|uniref:Rec8 like protein-domain-containing protein n=1 Tax=Dunaliella salina TaxID=3046 RepID=A0ABQ7H037_DUNSA|nr:Rec8 like protein-domain-containing protein [Dunaliella salina]|eukprot:KAF5840210.1 Rec8 like protein-domain-containing protein [Dunaliella salina]